MFGMDAGAPVVHTLSQRLELARQGPTDSGVSKAVDEELVWMVGNMVAVYLEMGCVEKPESLEC